MFFKISKIKSLMKKEYKNWGLHVGVTETGWLYIAGVEWVICQDLEECPKEFKGAVIELCGDLPNPGMAYLAQEDHIQTEMIMDYYALPVSAKVDANDEMCELSEAKDIIFRQGGRDLRLIENIKSQTADVIPDGYVELVDPEQLTEAENQIEGPFRQLSGYPLFVWHNGLTWYGVMPRGILAPGEDTPADRGVREITAVAAALGLSFNEYHK